MEKDKLSQAQIKTIETILKSDTIEEASRNAPACKATIYKWLKDPTFRKTLSQARDEIFRESLDTIKQASKQAVEKLIGFLNSEDDLNQRFAVKEILSMGFRIRELIELEERILELERAVVEARPTDSEYAS